MDFSYDVFTSAFLAKVTEYDMVTLSTDIRTTIVDGYMRRALAEFGDCCDLDFLGNADDDQRLFNNITIDDATLIEIQDIISDGMVVQWLRPYLYRIENLELTLNTRDFTTYSSANLLGAIRETYNNAHRRFIFACREYSYRHGDLTDLHI